MDGFGISVAVLPDLNADGTPDLAVGAWGHDSLGLFENGRVYVELLDPTQFLSQRPRPPIPASSVSRSQKAARPSFYSVFRGRIDLEDHD
jgi:hypothetical protein